MRRSLTAAFFVIGWILSPLTWWNDAFVNLPLSYLLASAIWYFIPVSFFWLVLGSYLLTNIVGLAFVYAMGKDLLKNSPNKFTTLVSFLGLLAAVTLIAGYLDRRGMLLPLSSYGGFFSR